MKKDSAPIETLVSFIIGMALAAPLALWRGFVVTKLWAWFVVPTFHTFQISLIQAVGVSLLLGFITHQAIDNGADKTSAEVIGTSLAASLIVPAFALLWGWIFSFLM